MSYLNNTKYQVKTPTGWQDFSGIKRSRRSDLIKLKTQSGKELTSTPEHRLSYNSTLKYVKDLKADDFIDNEIIESVENLMVESYVYDLIDVEDGHLYYTNGLISSNCAFIRDFDTIWTGLYPTISTGGSAILLSTPNGVGGQYYKLWTEAEAGQNEFNPIRLPWTVHPEHDQAWFEKETRNLRRRDIAQEFECDFISSGETYLQAEIMDQLRVNLTQPIEKSEIDRNVWIWKHPEFDHRYVISADVSRGDSGDYSAFTIIDVDEAELVVEYKGKLPPDKLADLLLEFGYRYNKALLCPENNTFGYTTCIKLREKGYPRLYYSAHKGDPFDFQSPDREDLPGFSTQQRSRVQILTNLEQLLRNNKLKIYSHRVYAELQTFVWNGIKAQASKDNHDDLIMSLAIGSWIGLGAGATTSSSSEFAAALLKATGVVRREFVSEADNVGPVRNHWSSTNFAAKSEYLKPQDPAKIRKSSQEINDFSWLLK